MSEEPKLIVMHETWLGSIASDIFTFAIMIFAFWANYTYIGNSIAMQIIITTTIVGWSMQAAKSTEIRGRKNIIKFLREYEKGE